MTNAIHPVEARRSLLESAQLAGHVWAQGYQPGAQPYPAYRELRSAMRVDSMRHPKLEQALWAAWFEGACEVRPMTAFGAL